MVPIIEKALHRLINVTYIMHINITEAEKD